jgi:hypothetical protein
MKLVGSRSVISFAAALVISAVTNLPAISIPQDIQAKADTLVGILNSAGLFFLALKGQRIESDLKK